MSPILSKGFRNLRQFAHFDVAPVAFFIGTVSRFLWSTAPQYHDIRVRFVMNDTLVTTIEQSAPESEGKLRVWVSGLELSLPTREVFALGVILGLLQVLDGVLTASGVSQFGIEAEGNLLIRALMTVCGVVPTMVMLKALALAVIGLLCAMAAQVRWIPLAMRGLVAIYLGVAVVPWTWIHITQIF